MKVLVLHHSYDGQTEGIARRLGEVIERAGHSAAVRRFTGPGSLDAVRDHDAVLLGAAIRYGHHDRAFEREVRRHAPALAAIPNAFFSVCLSAGGPGRNAHAAQGYIENFCRNTGWKPREATSFAGALQYSRYGFFMKIMMRMIVGHAGGETDTSRDYEYTDWRAVEEFARAFVERLPARAVTGSNTPGILAPD